MASPQSIEPIFIRASAKKNGLTSMAIGLVGLCLSLILLSVVPAWLFLGTIFLTSASIVAVLIGYFKLREPDFSIEISPTCVIYHHRRGKWSLNWDNVQRFDMPKVRKGLDTVPLETVGFKIKDYAVFIDSVSPRLATHLLMEQRPLLLQNQEDCPTGTCYGNEFLEDTQFTLEGGKKLTGVQAMLASRMSKLRERLGYDIFIGATELDREPQAFVALLRECQQARQNHL